MMQLKIYRHVYAEGFTLGNLYLDGVFECFTLEPPVKGKLIASNPGRYPVTVDFSPRFQKDMPHINGVPGMEGVRIHSGNSAADTEGCVLVGNVISKEGLISESRAAYDSLFEKLKSEPKMELLIN
jgi:hypothetical protein